MKAETRQQKWRKYRTKIKSLPERSFKPKEGNAISFSKADRAKLEGSLSPSYEPKLQLTPYRSYVEKKRRNLIMKTAALLVTVLAFVLVYFLWVI